MTRFYDSQVRNKGTYSVVQYFLRLVEARRTRRLDLSQQELDTVPIEVLLTSYKKIEGDQHVVKIIEPDKDCTMVYTLIFA